LKLADDISDFIKGLLDVPSSQSIDTAPIQLNQIADHVRRLVDLVYSSSNEPILTAKQGHALLEMCDYLQMPRVKTTIWKLAEARVNNMDATGMSPWEAFKLGALQNNPTFCYNALRSKHGYSMRDISSKPPSEYKDIPGQYLATLFIGNYVPNHKGVFDEVDVHVIAERFWRMSR
jgi:hypothetical protein